MQHTPRKIHQATNTGGAFGRLLTTSRCNWKGKGVNCLENTLHCENSAVALGINFLNPIPSVPLVGIPDDNPRLG